MIYNQDMTNFIQLNDHHLALEIDKVLINLSKFASSELSKSACLNLEVLNNKEKIEYALELTH